MKVNVDLVLKMRKDKAWSQDELAIASGLNLRTIQRIEKEATASLQSLKALASAFDMNIRDLKIEKTEKLNFIVIGVLVLAVAFLLIERYVLVDEPSDETIEPISTNLEEQQRNVLPNSVAVIPFENFSPDPDHAYFAAGIHEEILNQLAKVSALNVIARTSVLQYANTEKSVIEIASEMNVETVMEGSVRYADGLVRITTQLNDGFTGAHLWSETYTHDLGDIFAIQSDVAMNIANALEERESIEKVPTNSPVP